MNRDRIESGRTKTKLAESFALSGGVGALVYPLIFYYNGYVAIDKRDDFLFCKLTEKAGHEVAGTDYTDWVRPAMQWNCLMMTLYLALHFVLFNRPESV